MEEWQDRLLQISRQGENTWLFLGSYLAIENKYSIDPKRIRAAIELSCKQLGLKPKDHPMAGGELSLFKTKLLGILNVLESGKVSP